VLVYNRTDGTGEKPQMFGEARGPTMSLVEDDSRPVETEPIRLLTRATCPHCWETFPPDQVLWISEHVELLGDPMLGPERQQRFLPSRFTVDGDAIDARGMTCRSLACPHCHLAVPRGLLEMEPLFFSILGNPASGKSYFLTTMTWQLRQVLPMHFHVAFTDADPTSNRILNAWEESLFLNADEARLTPLGNLIRKTELQGELYDTVAYGQQTVSYPRPFLFTVRPQKGHAHADSSKLARMISLYDNAGEHFQPGQDTASSPVTRHLARSRAVMFLFDPTQDPRFRAACRGSAPAGGDGAAQYAGRLSRQETILNEAAARIRRHAGLPHAAPLERPLVVVLSKLDEWNHLLDTDCGGDPWRTQNNVSGVDMDRVEHLSGLLRRILLHYCPETVAAAEAFARDVTYIAVSSLGPNIRHDPTSGLPAIRPADIQPTWVTAPLLYCISQAASRLVPRFVKRTKPT
jgi:hypothetical protein